VRGSPYLDDGKGVVGGGVGLLVDGLRRVLAQARVGALEVESAGELPAGLGAVRRRGGLVVGRDREKDLPRVGDRRGSPFLAPAVVLVSLRDERVDGGDFDRPRLLGGGERRGEKDRTDHGSLLVGEG